MATLKPMTPLRPLIQASMKPPSPLRAPEQHALKPPSPLQPKNAPKTPISHSQRRWWFQPHARTSEQRRWRFQTSGPPGLQSPDAIPTAGGGAWPGFEPTRSAHTATQRRRCGGRRRDRRARAGFEIDHSEPPGSRVAISRAGRRPPAHTAARPHRAHRPAAISGSQAPSGSPTRWRHPSARAGAPNRRRRAHDPRPRR